VHGRFIASCDSNCTGQSTSRTLVVRDKSLLCLIRDECDNKDIIQMAWENIEKEAARETRH